WSIRHFPEHLSNDAARLKNFLATHGQSTLHVAFTEHRHGKFNFVVRSMWKVAAQIAINPGSAAREANDSKFARHFRAQHTGGFEAVARSRMRPHQFHKLLELRFKRVQGGRQS